MRRIVGTALAVMAVSAATLGASWGAAPHRDLAAVATSGWRQRPVQRVLYIRNGAEARCGPQICGNGGGTADFLLPGRGLYRVVVTESFEYKTTGDGRFRTNIDFFGSKVRPAYRALAASNELTSTTLVWVAKLKGGKYQSLGPYVDNPHPTTTNWSIDLSRVVAIVDARPVRSTS
jgi:hypothetical protein